MKVHYAERFRKRQQRWQHQRGQGFELGGRLFDTAQVGHELEGGVNVSDQAIGCMRNRVEC